MVGITKAANDRSYQRTEKQQNAPKATFRGCGQNSKSSQSILNVLVPSNHSPKSKELLQKLFSGLWLEIQKQPINTPKNKELLQKLTFGAVDGIPKASNDRSYTTAPKSNELLQMLVFGAVDGIPKAANDRSYHIPLKNWFKTRFRGRGQNSKSRQSKQKKQRITPKARFRGCGQNSKSSQSIQNVLVRSYHSPKKQRIVPKLILGAVDGIPKAANDRSYHNPDKQRIAPKAHFRGCGRLPKAANQYQMCLSDPTTAPKSNELLQKLLFGAVDGIPKQPMTDPTTAPKSNELLRSFIVLKPVLNDLVSRSKQKSAVKMAHRSHKNYKMAREPLKTQGMTDSAWYRQL